MTQSPQALRQQIEALSDEIDVLDKRRAALALEADVADHYMNRAKLASALRWPPTRLYRLLRSAGHPIRRKDDIPQKACE